MAALLVAGHLVEREFAGRRRAAREKAEAASPYAALLAPLPDAALPLASRATGGCGIAADAAAGPDGAAATAARTYVVRPGDTLARIARRTYGSESAWRAIYEANRAAIADPARLRPGAVIILPRRPGDGHR